MKIFRTVFGLLLLSILLYGCWTLEDAMGEMSFKNSRDILMVDIYKALKETFTDYDIRLEEEPESSSFMIFPHWGKQITKSHYHIYMASEEFSIFIQNGHDERGELTDIHIDFYIIGKNQYERLNELNEPMENMKYFFMNNFSEIIKNENITQRFKPIPYR